MAGSWLFGHVSDAVVRRGVLRRSEDTPPTHVPGHTQKSRRSCWAGGRGGGVEDGDGEEEGLEVEEENEEEDVKKKKERGKSRRRRRKGRRGKREKMRKKR